MGRRHRPHSAGVEEMGESSEWRGRGGARSGAEEGGEVPVWKRQGSHPCDVSSREKWSGPNEGAGSGVGMSGARIRETRVEQALALVFPLLYSIQRLLVAVNVRVR